MSDRFKITFFFLLVSSGVALRLLCRDIPNFAPVAALSLFAGFLFRNGLIAALVPISVLSISNLQLGGYESWPVMFSVYACFVMPSVLGRKFLQRDCNRMFPILPALGFSLAGSSLFFLVTNYTAWLYWYPKTFQGLVECYTVAIPFFRYTLMGDCFFCFMFFAMHALVVSLCSRRQAVANWVQEVSKSGTPLLESTTGSAERINTDVGVGR